MAKILTREEWQAAKPPFATTRITYDTWGDTHFDICLKWIEEHCEGWVWFARNDKTFVFGLKSDATLFDLWLEEGIVERERFSVDGKAE